MIALCQEPGGLTFTKQERAAGTEACGGGPPTQFLCGGDRPAVEFLCGARELSARRTLEMVMLAAFVIAADIAAVTLFLAGARRADRRYARQRA